MSVDSNELLRTSYSAAELLLELPDGPTVSVAFEKNWSNKLDRKLVCDDDSSWSTVSRSIPGQADAGTQLVANTEQRVAVLERVMACE